MKTFQYCVQVTSPRDARDDQTDLNMMGAKGWELCSSQRVRQHWWYRWEFFRVWKREVQS